jgi:hypothetical protein
MLTAVLIVCYSFSSTLLYAAELTGKAFALDGKTPVPGVVIAIRWGSGEHEGPKYTNTGSDGAFHVQVPDNAQGPFTIKYQKTGYTILVDTDERDAVADIVTLSPVFVYPIGQQASSADISRALELRATASGRMDLEQYVKDVEVLKESGFDAKVIGKVKAEIERKAGRPDLFDESNA